MTDKVIRIEDKDSSIGVLLERVMRMVPDRDKNDRNLRQLLAFRLRLDGEDRIREYLMQKIRAAVKCGYTGNFYDFIKNDLKEQECLQPSEGS